MTGSSDFAIGLYHQLSTTPGNLFFSPLSIRAALAMTSAGSKGATLDEMNTVLHLDARAPHDEFATLLHDLTAEPKNNEAPQFQFHLANAIWKQEGYPFQPAFLKLVQDKYRAEAQSLNFQNESAARKTINDWVDGKTQGKIKDLVPEGAIKPLTRLVLTNAVYFNARWENEFSKSATQAAPFHVSATESVDVPTMRRTARFSYVDDKQMLAIELPYAGHNASVIIMMPKSPDGIRKLESDLSATTLAETAGKMQPQLIDLSLPRFKVEQSIAMGSILQSLGMKLAFDADHADFSGMGSAEPFYISEVLHKAFVKTDEEGTEAAAATAVIMRAGSAMRRDEPLRVQIDKPFVTIIRHRPTGEILFMGRVIKPADQ